MSVDENRGVANGDYCTAVEAARTLGVKLPTLYAYVSRGQLHSVSLQGSRRRGYLRAEVAALGQRRKQTRTADSAARSALDWGLPVLDTELTLIADGKLYYRGLDATELATTSSLERVAALLWLGDQDREAELFGEALEPVPKAWVEATSIAESAHPSSSLLLAVQLSEMTDPLAGALTEEAMVVAGARIVRALVAAVARLKRRRRGPLVEILSKEWCRRRSDLMVPLNTALVLCADHELNVSSFTARCIASSGAGPYEAVCGGLCALRGYRHGGHSDRVEALFREVGIASGRRAPTREQVRRRLSARIQRGERLPGLGHNLYPNGDPRYGAILRSLEQAQPNSPLVRGMRRVAEEGRRLTGQHPTLDLGLAAVAATSGLPLGSAWTIFALGRSVGWIAHALEERRRSKLIRPRARYIGPAVGA